MNDEEWDSNIARARAQVLAKGTKIPDDVINLLELLVETGEKNPDNRKTIVVAMKHLLRGYMGYPWKRAGEYNGMDWQIKEGLYK